MEAASRHGRPGSQSLLATIDDGALTPAAPELRAEAQFRLAEVIDTAEATTLANDALAVFEATSDTGRIAEVRAWLEGHRVRESRP